jgi:hypothetical protein
MSEQIIILNEESSSPVVVSRYVLHGGERLGIRLYHRSEDGELLATRSGVDLLIEGGLAAEAVQALQTLLKGAS